MDLYTQALEWFEQNYNVVVIHAVLDGSRYHGWANEHSNYNLTIIYKHTIFEYLTIDYEQEFCEVEYTGSGGGIVVFKAYDLRNVVCMIRESRVRMLECLLGGNVVKTNSPVHKTLRRLADANANVYSIMYDYTRQAKITMLKCKSKFDTRLLLKIGFIILTIDHMWYSYSKLDIAMESVGSLYTITPFYKLLEYCYNCHIINTKVFHYFEDLLMDRAGMIILTKADVQPLIDWFRVKLDSYNAVIKYLPEHDLPDKSRFNKIFQDILIS